LISLPIFACLVWILFILIKQNKYVDIGIALNFGLALIVFFIVKNLFVDFFDKRFFSKYILFLSLTGFAYLFLPAQDFKKYSFSYSQFNDALMHNKKIIVVASASWCVTCHINEFNVFNTKDFKNFLAKSDVTYMYLDLTSKSEEGNKFLNSYKHVGVPFYILFNSNGKYEILPQILTKKSVIKKISNLT
jgi:thiol:disulfide interchange protein DsbD